MTINSVIKSGGPQNDLTRTIIAVRFWSLESSGIEYDRAKQLVVKIKNQSTKESTQVIFGVKG